MRTPLGDSRKTLMYIHLQGYLDYKKLEISKRSVSVSYLGGPIKKLSENARCPFLNYARKSLNFARK